MQNKTIEIPSDGVEVDTKIIKEFNDTYKKNFKVVGSENRDGVEFILIDAGENSLSNIYQLAFFHGLRIQRLRMEKI